ncbi:protein-tyrosine-phosphatase [Maribacter algarum]|uniref:Protein-tyrosine-phosphatase n=1 Tax=Maribacter algarum (ex Zhang et al. 2020) TaxID=2578118 RepID=A0A5S3PW88_9FLAO|nr:protein-tyrosine-phosphatase [Maribacter algarum]TMM58472.1 protein-tyrosine-phosphatase [Maribacter algarum]
MAEEPVFPEIGQTISSLDIDQISEGRKEVLNPLVNYIKERIANKKAIALNFICTHNSRRSHLSQVWAQTLAHYTGIKNIACYSGGTEATAMFPMAAETLKNHGFMIAKLSVTDNPVYSVKYSANSHPIVGFSKTFDDDFNPKSNFAAIMTCSSADKGCPFVGGSDGRFQITFEDPKAFDNTPQQKEKYRERSLQIATELLYVMKQAVE